MISNPNNNDRLYLAKGDEGTIYIDNGKMPQQTINGIRFLYKQFRKKKNGVILNDPFSLGRNIQICLFLKAIRPLLHRPILILCQEGSEQEWVDRFHTWTDETLFNEVAIETVKPFINKMVMINNMVNLHLFCAREWSIVVVDGDHVTTPILKLPFKASFKIWNTSVDMKTNLDRFEEVYKWLYPRVPFDKNDFVADSTNCVDIIEKAILIDTLFEDVVLRRDDQDSSLENLHTAYCEKTPQTTITFIGPTTPCPYRMGGNTSIHPVRCTTVAPTSGDSIILQKTHRYGDTTIIPTNVASKNVAPTNIAATNVAPTTVASTNVAPTNINPTNIAATNVAPATAASTNEAATTVTPTNETSTTVAPTTVAPTNEVPTTEAPTNETSTTVAPTTVTHSTSCVPRVGTELVEGVTVTTTITKKNKDATGTKIKRSKTRIESETANESFIPPIAVLTKLLKESPKPEDDRTFRNTVDFSIENYKNNGQQSTESSKTKTDKQIAIIEKPDAVAQTVSDKLEELDTIVYGHDTLISKVSAIDISAKGYNTSSDRKDTEPQTILTCKPVGEHNTRNKLFTDNKKSTSTITSETSSGCSDNTERDKKNDSEMLKSKSTLSTDKPEVDITKINLDDLNSEMIDLDTRDKTEQLVKRQKTADSSETATCCDDIIKEFSEQNKQISVSCTKVNTEQVANSLKRINVDVQMKECEEAVVKKFKGSLLDSLF